ncbi:MAG: glycosyltransferase [Desulfamplus sp.]|nr:glycosyltransferase [Desulfamplus sp.]
MYADAINAVSHGYSLELLEPQTSHKNLWLYLRKREQNFTGILNGCDYKLWNPKTDKYLNHHFSIKNMAGKSLCKSDLQAKMGLPLESNAPLFGLVSRLTSQKGFDYLLPALERLLYEDAPIQIVMVGSGEHRYSLWIHHLQKHYPHKMSFINGYDNGLAHLIEAGSDFFMMPSLFEPCGLNQLYSLAYGTIPIIRQTGGLQDTVLGLSYDYDNSNIATGISFGYPDTHNCYEALIRAIKLYLDHKSIFLQMQMRAMEQKFTWEESAKQYEILYSQL